jgi:uridine monophosphate synthetase
MPHKDLILSLNRIGAIKFGEFTLKSGALSPIYITLRTLISHADVMDQVAAAYVELLKPLKYDRMAALPYAAMPIVGAIAAVNHQPWIYKRKEAKGYGIKLPLEGEYTKGETVIIVDDLVAEGTSKFESIQAFEAEGLQVKDVAVLLDREQGADQALAKRGYQLHSVFKMSDVLGVLHAEKAIDDAMVAKVKDFLTANRAKA